MPEPLPGFWDRPVELDASLEQWLTPAWVAEALLERHFADLGPEDLVIEPGCGTGRWMRVLARLFPWTRVLGVEIDARLAEHARNAGCEVVVGDYGTVPLPAPTAIVGNWPFGIKTFERFLERSHRLLPQEGRCGVLTSVHSFQTSSRVLRYAEHWSIETELLPRDMFPNIESGLVFAMFRKERRRRLIGLGLYDETGAARALLAPYRAVTDEQPTTWRAAVESALERLGGCATLELIYAETTKPTGNQWWKEKIRQVLQRYAVRLDDGVWGLPSLASATVA